MSVSAPDVSIVLAVYNDIRNLPRALRSLSRQTLAAIEFIVVDDCSTDATNEIAKNFVNSEIKLIRMETNSGKGAAVRKGIEIASGNYILIQDADLEYFPSDIKNLLDAALKNPGAVVYGSRVLGAKRLNGIRGKLRLWPKQAKTSWVFNFLLSCAFRLIYKIWITDLLTGYKLYPSKLFQDWKPKSNGFEADHEITSKVISKRFKIVEIPIQYKPRSKSEGKKIRAMDGIIAFVTIWNFRR